MFLYSQGSYNVTFIQDAFRYIDGLCRVSARAFLERVYSESLSTEGLCMACTWAHISSLIFSIAGKAHDPGDQERSEP